MEMKLSWASTYAEERAGTLYDTVFETQWARKRKYPKKLFWCDFRYYSNTRNLPGEQKFPEQMTNLSIWPVQFNKPIHSPDTEPSYSQVRYSKLGLSKPHCLKC